MRQATSEDGETDIQTSANEPGRGRRRDPAPTARTCALTRRERPTSELIRFVAGPENRIYIDLARKLPGRGVWITADHASVAAAVKTGAFARSLKTRVTVAPGLADETGDQLSRRASQALSLANKAGLLATGFDKVATLVDREAVFALLHASDASPGGRQKLDGKFRALARVAERPATIIDCLSIDELSLAIGRPNVVHAALTAGGAADRFLEDALRLTRYHRGLTKADGEPQGQQKVDAGASGPGCADRATDDGEAPS